MKETKPQNRLMTIKTKYKLAGAGIGAKMPSPKKREKGKAERKDTAERNKKDLIKK